MSRADGYLLLLGALSEQHMHGYELAKRLCRPTQPLALGKANLYRLLAQMEVRGWVHATETMARRKMRRTYAITSAGREAFVELLRNRLGQHDPPGYPDGVSLQFVGALPPDEALALLEDRAAALAERCRVLASDPDCPSYLLLQAEIEQQFLERMLKELKPAD